MTDTDDTDPDESNERDTAKEGGNTDDDGLGLDTETATAVGNDTATGTNTDGETADATEEEGVISDTMLRYLYRGAFAALALLALVATVQFYTNASRTISVWIAPDYEPMFQAAFNLVMVFACAIGLSLLVQEFR